MRALFLASLMAIPLLASCEQVLGVDFASFKGPATVGGGCSPIGGNTCGTGKGCISDGTTFSCQTIGGQSGQDDTCTKEADCAAGDSCIKFTTNNSFHCSSYCLDNGGCATGHICHDFAPPRMLASGQRVGACGPLENACDPTAATSACAPNGRCTIFDTDYTTCQPFDGKRAVGQVCDSIDQCVAGASCIGNTTNGYLCTPMCRVGGNDCALNQTCSGFTPAFKLGTDEIGYCQ